MPTTHQTDDINIYKNKHNKKKENRKKGKESPPTNQVSNPESYWSSYDSWKGIRSRLYKSNKRPIAGGGAQALGRNLLLLLY